MPFTPPVATAIGRVVFSVDDRDGVAVPKLSIRGEYHDATGKFLYQKDDITEAQMLAEITPAERTGLLGVAAKFRAAFVASLP
jgi:hypothetical protein